MKEEDAASEAEDDTLRDSDLIILAARNDDDVSHLEVLPHPALNREIVALAALKMPLCWTQSRSSNCA